jgi:actin-related protein
MTSNAYYLQEQVSTPPPDPFEDWRTHPASQAIVFDNGASFFRAGWAGESDPRVISENVVSKYRDRKTNTHVVLAGNAVYADANAKLNIKFPYEGDVLCAIDAVVCPLRPTL